MGGSNVAGVLGELMVPPSPLSCCDALALLCASRSFVEAWKHSLGIHITITQMRTMVLEYLPTKLFHFYGNVGIYTIQGAYG